MNLVWRSRIFRFILASAVGGLLGVAVIVAAQGYLSRPGAAARAPAPAPDLPEDNLAWRYARAYQTSDWGTVVDVTLWMQDRLRRVRAEDVSPAVEQEARQALLERLQRRTVEDNHLRNEGVEDQYLFAPAATIEVVGKDSGPEGLARPAASRSWLRVTYPSKWAALMDHQGLPIRSVEAGVSVSEDGYVLKAAVLGNAEVRWESISYDWDSATEESADAAGGRRS